MASIRDVAKKAGVAACTVSRVLNGTATVSPETRVKIEKAMKELDYIPNELARGMFRQKSGIIAMLVPSIKHPFFSSLADYIEKELYVKGYKLMLCSTSGSIEREQEYLNTFKSNLVDGIIMAVNSLPETVYEKFAKPMVMLDCQISENIPFVVSDHKMGGRLAAEEFIKNNCHHVLHLCAEKEEKKILSYEGHETLEQILSEHGIKTRGQEIRWNSFDLNGYRELAELILKNYPDIDGIMAADMAALAFYEAGQKLGKRIPDELCIIAYDGTYILDVIDANLTTIVQNLELYSAQVVDTILTLIENPGEHVKNIYVPVSLRNVKSSKITSNSY
ncbi:hypothetical protein C818_01978 [Lachnospiraceae bacterium MD308]|jgi:Transcriptional regulators|nr:hypothetical protein C818_01978 [Lachnospiraceae bacterium MD308]MCI8503077.1 LacI family transcriptional regulator [Dorea sp.]